MKHLMLCILLLCLCVFLPTAVVAQWPTQADQNLMICDHTGEQALPKICATSDGGCYIAWYDHSSGNYDVYLQRLNSAGVPQWTVPCGMLISNHTQDSWITDWSMTVDLEDHCIIAVNDLRAGGDWDIYGYRISPAGEFVWGADGIAISDNDNFEPDPQLCVTSDGGIVFAWQESTDTANVINLRKLSTAGTDMLIPTVITITATNGVSIPRLTAADGASFILQYLIHQGTQFWAPRHIYMQKFDAVGEQLWFEDPTAVMTTGGIGVQMEPDVIHDGIGGAYSYWYDTRNMDHHCFVQHVTNLGVAEWTANGVQTDLSAAELQMYPALTVTNDGVVVFYAATNTGQTQGGLQVQKLDTAGARQWGDNGIVLIPHMTDPTLYLYAYTQGNNATVTYGHYVNGSAINWVIRAIQVDNATGAEVWTPSPRDLCSVESDKSRLNVAINCFDQIIATWPDSRTETSDIYAQNINPDGSLGPLGEPPPTIAFVTPQDGDTVTGRNVVVEPEVSNFVVASAGGDGVIEFRIDGVLAERFGDVFPYLAEITPGTHLLRFELVDYDYNPLDPPAYDEVTITVIILPPSIEITSPVAVNDTAYIGGLETELVFDVENFIVGESEGDGQIDFWLFGFHLAYLNNTNSIPITFMNQGTHEVRLELVDFEHQSLDPPVYDVIWISTDAPNMPPTSFMRLAPEDSTLVDWDFDMNWSSSTDPEGETIYYLVDVWSPSYELIYPQDTVTTDTTVNVIIDVPLESLDEIIWINWTIHATDGIDTIEASNGMGAFRFDLPGAVNDGTANQLLSFALLPAYPNPFNPETAIRFDVAAPTHVALTVHDLLGRQVATLLNDFSEAGHHSIVWQGTNDAGLPLPSGVYFVKMNADVFTAAQKLMLIR